MKKKKPSPAQVKAAIKAVKLKRNGKPRKKNKGRDLAITEEDAQNLEKCFEKDYNASEACDEAKVAERTFYARCKDDLIFCRRMVAARKRAFNVIQSKVMEHATRDPDFGLKVLERRKKKQWSPQITHDMKMQPIKIVFESPTKFGAPVDPEDQKKLDEPDDEDTSSLE